MSPAFWLLTIADVVFCVWVIVDSVKCWRSPQWSSDMDELRERRRWARRR